MNIETELRAALADEATFAGDLPDPYPTFLRRETKRRRTRRLRVATAIAAVVTVVAATVGFQAMSGRHRTAPAAVPPTVKALLDSPLRGSLAKDQTFVKAMTARVSPLPGTKLLYASDVGDQRLVLASVPAGARSTLTTSVQDAALRWFTAARGASARQLRESQSGPLKSAASLMTASNDKTGVAVTVGPQGYTATLTNRSEAHYTAQGTVERSTAVTTGAKGSGIIEMVIPPQTLAPVISTALVQGDQTFPLREGVSWEESGINFTALRAQVRSALHGRDFDLDLLASWVMGQVQNARLPLTGIDVKIRWVGKLNGRKVAVYTAQQPGQGVLAFAQGTIPDGSGAVTVDLQLLLPAEGIDTRPIAYRLTKKRRPGPQVVVVAPKKATRVTVTPEGGKPLEVHLSSSGMGTVTIPPDQEATATAYAADGSAMGSTPVRGGTVGYGEMIGDTPATRVVP